MRIYKSIDFSCKGFIAAFFEAFLLTNPEEASRALTFRKAKLIEIAKESDWGLHFDINREEIVERIKS